MLNKITTLLFANCLILALLSTSAKADPNYHLVGWINAFMPGGGQLLLGDYPLAAGQAALEITTFGWGYSLSAKSPMTLDGVPEVLPSPGLSGPNGAPQNLWTPLEADILQEFGLKYHMVNVFNSYREAAKGSDERIDMTPTGELFAAPFKAENILDPWVWIPVTVSSAAILVNYFASINQHNTPVAPLTGFSNSLYAFNYTIMYPVGSAAPEEMFYRGFLQNEFYSMVDSPYFSIPLTTLVYTFSHTWADAPSAAITGLYLSFLAHHNQGKLSKGITFHFWADFLAGIAAYGILRNAEGLSGPPSLQLQFEL